MILTAIHHAIEAIEVAPIVDGKPSSQRAFVILTPTGNMELVDAQVLLMLFQPEAPAVSHPVVVSATKPELVPVAKEDDPPVKRIHVKPPTVEEGQAPPVDRTGIAAAIREALAASSPSTLEDIAQRVTAKHKHIRADQVKGNLHPMRTAGEIEIDPDTRGLGPGIKWRFAAPKDASA